MLHRIGRHVDGGDVVTEDKRSRAKGAMKLLKQLTHPTALGQSMGHNAVLSFCTRTWESSLSLGRPRDETITIVDIVTRRRSTRVRTARPIKIRVGCQGGRGRSTKLQAEVQGTPNVPENTLHKSKVRHAISMHVKAYQLNYIGYVRTSECKILKSPCKTPVICSIQKQVTISSESFELVSTGVDEEW
jgi:hypothetical protein